MHQKIELLDTDGNTALHLAAAKGNKIPAKMLLRHQQQLQKQQKYVDIINLQNKKGNTALALAAVEGNSDRNEGRRKIIARKTGQIQPWRMKIWKHRLRRRGIGI